MSLRKYGICLAFAPNADLKKEGFGRYLANFLKGSHDISDVHWVIVCPHWSGSALNNLFSSEGIVTDNMTIISPRKKSFIWYMYCLLKNKVINFKKISFFSRFKFLFYKMNKKIYHLLVDFIGSLTILKAIFYTPLFILAGIIVLIIKSMRKLLSLPSCQYIYRKICSLLTNLIIFLDFRKIINNHEIIFDLYNSMESYEIKRMQQIMKKNKDVIGWYCPTSFWPGFSAMDIPILTCMPDDHMSEFPIGFARKHLHLFVRYKRTLEKTITSGRYFVTYSEFQKWNNLVNRHHISPSNVFTVKHANNNLNAFVEVMVNNNVDLKYYRVL